MAPSHTIIFSRGFFCKNGHFEKNHGLVLLEIRCYWCHSKSWKQKLSMQHYNGSNGRTLIQIYLFRRVNSWHCFREQMQFHALLHSLVPIIIEMKMPRGRGILSTQIKREPNSYIKQSNFIQPKQTVIIVCISGHASGLQQCKKHQCNKIKSGKTHAQKSKVSQKLAHCGLFVALTFYHQQK